jgi:hypothetical protein
VERKHVTEVLKVIKVTTIANKTPGSYQKIKGCGVKDKAVPLQAWSGPEGSRNLRFPIS